MEKGSDMTLTCRQCGREFVFTEEEQEFYKAKGYNTPHHCKQCRLNRRNQALLLCSNCGTKLGNGSAVYCAACLSTTHLEFELEARKLTGLLDEANTKLKAAESERAQLADSVNERLSAVESERINLIHEAETKVSIVESKKAEIDKLLEQEKQITVQLQEQLNSARFDLEKALKYRATLDGLEPALNSIKERVELLERSQNSLNQAMLRLIQGIGEMRGNRSLWQAFRQILQPHQKSPASTGD